MIDLGFTVNVRIPTPKPKPMPLEVKRRSIIIKEIPKEYTVEFKPEVKKLHELMYVIPKEVVKELSLMAESEVLMASNHIDNDIVKVLRMMDLRGIRLKIVLNSSDCRGLRGLGLMSARCYLKTLALRLLTRIPFAAYALMVQPKVAPDLFYTSLGVLTGLTSAGLASLVGLTYFLNPQGWTYTQLPWVLKASALTSIITSFYVRKGKPLNNAEVRVLGEVPSSYFIVDGKKAIVTECPLTSTKPCLARVYKDGAYEALREFNVLWDVSQGL